LRGRKVEIIERDFFKEPFTKSELEELIGARPITDFISTRAKSFKATGWDKKAPTKAQAIAAILENPTLLRRPILIVRRNLIIGWSLEEYSRIS
jgi:arsenate reductase-like glutaredoxin family protein